MHIYIYTRIFMIFPSHICIYTCIYISVHDVYILKKPIYSLKDTGNGLYCLNSISYMDQVNLNIRNVKNFISIFS